MNELLRLAETKAVKIIVSGLLTFILFLFPFSECKVSGVGVQHCLWPEKRPV
jgi:hypothetical protein